MSWQRFFISLLVPVGFTAAVYSHLRHPWLPKILGDLPYREAITVAFMIWSMYLYAASRASRAKVKVACRCCHEVYTLARWLRDRRCPACRHDEYDRLPDRREAAARKAPERRQPGSPKPNGRLVSPVEAGTMRLSLDEKRRVKGRIDTVLAGEMPADG